MKRYATEKSRKGNFTYVADWYGFNLPSWVFDKHPPILTGGYDPTPYDEEMEEITYKIRKITLKKYKTDKFYLIGIAKKYIGEKKKDNKKIVKSILKHEIHHGMFYLIPDYKKLMTDLVKSIPKKKRKKIKKALVKMGYANDKQIIIDETAAYMATGLIPEISFMENSKSLLKKFKKAYKKFAPNSKDN